MGRVLGCNLNINLNNACLYLARSRTVHPVQGCGHKVKLWQRIRRILRHNIDESEGDRRQQRQLDDRSHGLTASLGLGLGCEFNG